jgi:phospholipid/cholesterol/gamma-HCH transport system substrate-binding protein
MSQSARDVLRRIDSVLVENAQPLRTMISNLNIFAGALARNSDRLDGIVAGLERMTGGGGAGAHVVVYDLTVPRIPAEVEKTVAAQVVIQDPTVLAALDTEKIQSMSAGGVTSPLPDAQWSDTLPKLLQMKIIRGFEDANLFGGVSRPLDGLSADFQLLVDIRKFQVTASPTVTAEVELAAKVLDNTGRLVATHIFRATAPAGAPEPPAAVAALDQTFGKAAAELMPWAAHTIADRHGRIEAPKAVAPKKSDRKDRG